MVKMKDFEGEKAQFLPDQTYTSKMTVLPGEGADRVELHHYGAGHTNGDTIVVFPALRVAHTGDLFAQASDAPASTSAMEAAASPIPRPSGWPQPPSRASTPSFPATRRRRRPGAAFVEFGEFNAAFLAAARQAFERGKTR